MKVWNSLKSISRFYKQDKIRIIVLSIAIIIYNLEGLLYSALWGFILQSLMAQKFFDAVLFILLHLVLFVFDALLEAFVTYMRVKIETRTLKDIQVELFRKVINFPAIAFEEHGVGEFNNRINNDTDQIISLFTNFLSLISRFIAAIIIIVIFMKVNIIIGIEVIIFGIVSFFITKYFSPRMKAANKKLKEENDELMKDTTQILTGIREVKSLGIKQIVTSLTNKKFTNVYKSYYDSSMLSATHSVVEWISYALCEFIILFTASFLFYKGYITIAIIVLVYNYMGRINWAITSYTQFMTDYQKMSVSFDRLDSILNDKMYKPEPFGNTTLSNANGQIEFKNVSFTYDNDERSTLNDINITIKPNIKTAIVGASGSGKTSMFNLLARYFNPTEGEITIDDIPISELTEDSLRNNIGVIRQDTFLFNMSIMDNFRMVKEDITLKEVRAACKKAYIDKYIMDLPDAYDTIIGENGVNLSGGQKQRLSIARTLVRNTKIILFDEATSALDNKSQEYIKKTIDELVKDHTIVIIAHRLSTIVDSDEIILVDKGKIVATGTHKKLMKNAKYKELYQPDIIK